jgi:hypothetical protein
MIPGIVASMASRRGGGGGGGGSGSVLDFMAGTYTIDGTSYAVGDIFADVPNANTFGAGSINFASIIPGRGWVFTVPAGGEAQAIGALRAKLMQPHTVVIEYEDMEGYVSRFLDIRPFGSSNDWAMVSAGDDWFYLYLYDNMSIGFDFDTYRNQGLNRIAWTLGSAQTCASSNGGTPPNVIDTSPSAPIIGSVFAQDYFTDGDMFMCPFGHGASFGPCDVIIRKMTILAPVASSDMAGLTALATPGFITDLSVTGQTDTTVTLTFTPPSGSPAGYEYWIKTGTTGGPTVALYDWFPLVGSTITGLSASTSYRVAVRAVNAQGPGPGTTPLTATTTA